LRLDPKHISTLNSLAWVLATCPDSKVRDGKRAVALGKQLNDLMKWKVASGLDTLAAGHAEMSDFAEAVRIQKMALDDNKLTPQARTEYQARLKLYEQNKPYRED
jgi:hypothetical protein